MVGSFFLLYVINVPYGRNRPRFRFERKSGLTLSSCGLGAHPFTAEDVYELFETQHLTLPLIQPVEVSDRGLYSLVDHRHIGYYTILANR